MNHLSSSPFLWKGLQDQERLNWVLNQLENYSFQTLIVTSIIASLSFAGVIAIPIAVLLKRKIDRLEKETSENFLKKEEFQTEWQRRTNELILRMAVLCLAIINQRLENVPNNIVYKLKVVINNLRTQNQNNNLLT